jgi:transposase-like protein
MRKHRSYPIEFKRQVAQEYLAGETLHGLAKRHEINRNLVRIWVAMRRTSASSRAALSTFADTIFSCFAIEAWAASRGSSIGPSHSFLGT